MITKRAAKIKRQRDNKGVKEREKEREKEEKAREKARA